MQPLPQPPTPAPPAPPAAVPAPRPLQALAAFLLAIVLVMLLGTAVQAIPGPWRAPAQLLAVQLGSLLAVAVVVLTSRVPARAYLRLGAPPPRAWAGAAVLGLGVLLFAGAVLVRLYALFDQEAYGEMLDRLMADVQQTLGAGGVLLVVAGVAPLCEELLFRGVILRALLQAWPPWAAVLASALLFGLYHLHPVHGVVALVLGLACGAAAVLSGSLWPAVLIHGLNNAVVTLYSLSGDAPDTLPLAVALPAVALAATGLVILRRAAPPPEPGPPRPVNPPPPTPPPATT